MMEIINAVRNALGNLRFAGLFCLSLVGLFVLMKGRKKDYVVPCVLIAVVVFNPFFYQIWNHINNYAYWRTIWMVPIIPVCAAMPAVLVENGKKSWVKGGIAVGFAAVVLLSGSYIYSHPNTTFSRAANAEKLPDSVIKVADALLDLDDTPYVIADDGICIFLRQYSGKIQTMYARDVYYGIPSNLAKMVFKQLTEPDGNLQKVSQIMLNYDYEYLVASDPDDDRKASLKEAGFVLIEQIDDYGIYRVTGIPTEVRTYNDRHQVTALTYVDKDGNPINGSNGYATEKYTYDQKGWITKELFFDEAGNPAIDSDGKAGFERSYGRKGQIIQEVWLGTDEKPVEAGGYAMRKCTYNSDLKLETEAYYDASEVPMNRTDTHYAERKLLYDEKGNLAGERYFGLDGQPVTASSGYAGYDKVFDENNRLIRETYLGIDNNPVAVEDGYCTLVREYDENDNITAEYYLDEKGQRTLCTKGYAFVGKEYNEDGKVLHEWYEDPQGNGILLSDGYAGIAKEYDDSGNETEIRYLGINGEEIAGPKGYSKVIRVYDTNDRLVSESYFNDGKPVAVKEGYAKFVRFYDQTGNLIEERFFDDEDQAVLTAEGFASVRHHYDKDGRKQKDLFFDTEGKPALIGSGYSQCQYTYKENGELSLVYYYDQEGNQIEAGSGYLHEYFQSLLGKDVFIIMAAKDEASKNMTGTLVEDMKQLGIQTDLRGQFHKSFYAVVTQDNVVEELSDDKLVRDGMIGDMPYAVESAGYLVGNSCSIMIDGEEYAKKARGLNIVVFDNKKKMVTDTVAFDIYAQDIKVTR